MFYFVVVTYLTAGAKKTSFADRTFSVGKWQATMLTLLCNLRHDQSQSSAQAQAVIQHVNTLKRELEEQDANNMQPVLALRGDTYLFDGRDLHWGNASENAGEGRFVVYSQAVSWHLMNKFISDRDLQLTVLTTYYSAEYVVDRRTIASPTFLHNLWLYNSPDVLKINDQNIAKIAKELWDKLSPLAIGPHWPSPVCQCCVSNDDADIVLCTAEHCQMGAIHTNCMPFAERRPDVWKCSSCQTSGK